MSRRSVALRRGTLLALASSAALCGATATAVADPGGSHGKSDESSARASHSTVTEDNDSDGTANNVADDGDNRHPSGKDRSVESGGSGNQGRAQADPDGMDNGGVDQPGGAGGVDELDQDGNNGCGNDDDFEDDNNGNCLGRQDNAEGDVLGTVDVRTPDTTVGSDTISQPEAGLSQGKTEQASVLGVSFTRAPSGEVEVAGVSMLADALPFTGLDAVSIAVLGLVVAGAGTGLVVTARKARTY